MPLPRFGHRRACCEACAERPGSSILRTRRRKSAWDTRTTASQGEYPPILSGTNTDFKGKLEKNLIASAALKGRALHFSLKQLTYFATVARTGSFMAASRELNVSQPALGYQVRKLEGALGVELLERLPRGVLPTPAGKELLGHAEAVMDRLDQASAALAAYRMEPMRDYAFGVTPTSGKALVPELLDACSRDRRLKLQFREGLSAEIVNQLLAGRLDMGVCYNPPPRPHLPVIPLFGENMFLVGPPELIGDDTSGVRFAELSAYPLMLDTRFQLTRGLIERLAQEQGVRLNVTIEIESTDFKRELLVAKRCCTVASYGLFLHEITAGLLRGRHIVAPSINRTLCLIGRPGLPNDDLEFMRATLAPIVAGKIAEGRLCWHPL